MRDTHIGGRGIRPLSPLMPLLIAAAAVLVIIIVTAALTHTPPPGARPGATEMAQAAGPEEVIVPVPHLPVGVASGPAASAAFTTLLGVRLCPDEPATLHLVGTLQGGLPLLSPWRVAEYFATCLRSYYTTGQAPAMSIDPTPEQVAQGMQMRGDMKVRYEGNCAGTALGLMTFAADRRMKCLALGRDNLFGTPVTIPVEGFGTVTDKSLKMGESSAAASANRLWIQPGQTSVVLTGDLVRLDVKMQILVKKQTVVNGALVDVETTPDPATRAFVEHMNEHYDSFAAYDPVYAEVRAGAQAAALARLVWERANSSDPGDDLPVDVDWWLNSFPLRSIPTPATTPVGSATKSKVTTREVKRGTVTTTAQVTMVGGVNLEAARETYRVQTSPHAPRFTEQEGAVQVPVGPTALAAGRGNSPELAVLQCDQASRGRDWRLRTADGRGVATLGNAFFDVGTPAGAQRDAVLERLSPVLPSPSGGSGATSRPIVLVEHTRPGQKANRLGRLRPDLDFYCGRTADLAGTNFDRLRAAANRPREIQTIFIKPSFSDEQFSHLHGYGMDLRECPPENWAFSMDQIQSATDTVVVVGERGAPGADTSGPVFQAIEGALSDGKLAGKSVVLVMCTDASVESRVSALFDDPNLAPACVQLFVGEVDAARLPGLLKAVSAEVGENPHVHPGEMLPRALERMGNGANEADREGARQMERTLIRQLSQVITVPSPWDEEPV